MNQVFSTDAVGPADRAAYWTDMICNVYVQLSCDPWTDDGFRGRIANHKLPGLELSVVSSRAQKVARTAGDISRSADDCFLVSIQTQGVGVVRQDDRDALLMPGDFALYDSTRRYELLFQGDFEQIVLKLPGDRLRGLLRDPSRLTATTVSGRTGAGHVLLETVKTLRDTVDELEPASAVAVADGVFSILAAGLQTLPTATARTPTALTAYHLARIRQQVENRLNDPDFSVASLAAELSISVGHAHRLFKDEPESLANYIWSRRLEASSRDLLDPLHAGRAISEIAYARGFNDAAHFSRAFRERFGCTPREWRRHASPSIGR